MNILVVEDEKIILDGICEYLESLGYICIKASDGQMAIEKFQNNKIDMLLLDVMLPIKNGLEVLKVVRENSKIPVLMLTALGDDETMIKSFDLLVDGYITKPFSLAVLGKRIEAIKKRYYTETEIWVYEDVRVNFSAFEATYKGQEVKLTTKEFEVLRLLCQNENQVLSRSQILDHIWEDVDDAPIDRIVDAYIKELRKKLNLDCIKTIKNLGYVLQRK